MTDIIQTENLSFSYPDEEGKATLAALNGVSLDIAAGIFLVVLGHNGSGKSTLAKHMNAVLLPAGGKVWVDGMDTADENLLLEIRRRVGMVFQNPDNQIVANVVEEDVAFGPENLGVPTEEIRRRVDGALKAVGMEDFVLHAPHHLSGGQKQRVAIASAIASKRSILFFDEPTSGLDYKHMKEVALCLKQLKELGKSVFVITHDVELIYHCCTYVVHIEAGKVINQYAIDKSTHTLLRDYFLLQ